MLEWGLDPARDVRLPQAGAYDLRDMGVTRPTDVIGGFRALTAAGLSAS